MTETEDKSKMLRMELLMEKLRAKGVSNTKPLGEIAKAVKMAILERKVVLDAYDKTVHQKSLDLLQKRVKVTTRQSLTERLESLSRQLGLKYMVGSSGDDIYISSDMFYLEILFESNSKIKDVLIHHEGKNESQNCPELVNCLLNCDFDDFSCQLEQLSLIYQLNADKKVKRKAFIALQSLEIDLHTLYQLQNHIKDTFQLIHQSPIGILEKRKGGHALNLFYFISPYDLINKEHGTLFELSSEEIIQRHLGYYLSVSIEGSSSSYKLQITPIVFINQNLQNKSSPSYAALNSQNTFMLPACFVLNLNRNIPITTALLYQIEKITEIKQFDYSKSKPLMSLIRQAYSNNQLKSTELYVKLTDQSHCYFLTETRDLEGIAIEKIFFTHPSQIAQIIGLLRQQVLFNVVVSSCIRIQGKPNFDNLLIFEINALDWQHLTISMEHPIDETLVAVELDLNDLTNLQCTINSVNNNSQANNDFVNDLALKTFQKSFSIPLTLRSIWRFWNEQREEKKNIKLLNGDNNNSSDNFHLSNGSSSLDPSSGHHNNSNNLFNEFDAFNTPNDVKGKLEPNNNVTYDCNIIKNRDFSNLICKDSAIDEISGNRLPISIEDPDANLENSSDSTTTSLVSQPEIDLSGFDSNDLLEKSKDIYDEYGEMNDYSDGSDDIVDVDDNNDIKRKSNDNVLDLMSSSISITPITSSTLSPNNLFNQMNDKRSSVEIIPITSSQGSQSNLSNTVTITPLKIKDKKSAKSQGTTKNKGLSSGSGYDLHFDKSKSEKKRKRRKDDGVNSNSDSISMGPPLKQMRSISPIIKQNSDSNSNVFKHFMKNLEGVSVTPTSPKNNSSGKPSISTLKSAQNSPSHKGIEPTYKPKLTIKDKDKKLINNVLANNTTIKPKVSPNLPMNNISSMAMTNTKVSPKIDCSTIENQLQQQMMASSTSPVLDSRLSPTKQVQKSRKNSLSDVIDKLKLVQNTEPLDLNQMTKVPGVVIRNSNSSNVVKTSETKKNSEYMIKPSSDGMKITINKTKSKESKTKVSNKSLPKSLSLGSTSSSSLALNNSGVGSSIKRPPTPQTSTSIKSQTSMISKPSTSKTSLSCGPIVPKSNLIGYGQKTSPSLPLQSSTITKSSDVRNKRLTKSTSDKSIFNSINRRVTSPKDEFGNDSVKMATTPVSIMLTDSLQKMNFPKNFHIPKLSARNNRDESETKKLSMVSTTGITTKSTTPTSANSSQLFDMIKHSSHMKSVQDKKDLSDACNDLTVIPFQQNKNLTITSNSDDLTVGGTSRNSTIDGTLNPSIMSSCDINDHLIDEAISSIRRT